MPDAWVNESNTSNTRTVIPEQHAHSRTWHAMRTAVFRSCRTTDALPGREYRACSMSASATRKPLETIYIIREHIYVKHMTNYQARYCWPCIRIILASQLPPPVLFAAAAVATRWRSQTAAHVLRKHSSVASSPSSLICRYLMYRSTSGCDDEIKNVPKKSLLNRSGF